MKLVIPKFLGIAPRYQGEIPDGMAQIAEAVDLFSGKIRPVKDDVLVQSAPTETGTSMAHDGTSWVFGDAASLITWPLDGLDCTFKLDDGVLKKVVEGVEANVGQPRPAAPTVTVVGTRQEIGGTPDGHEWVATTDPTFTDAYFLAQDERTLAFTSGGTTPIAVSDTITGVISAATATVEAVTVTSGSWAGGDAAGTLTLSGQSGTFQAEDINVGATNVATVGEDSGYQQPTFLPPSGPYSIEIDGEKITNTLGAAQFDGVHGWMYGNMDSLGFSTIYVVLADDSNPDTHDEGFIVWLDNPGNKSGDLDYIVTTVRNVGGQIDESGPSEPSTATTELQAVKINRPTLPDYATHWRVYRQSAETAAYQLVGEEAAASTYLTDAWADADLGDAPESWFTSEDGNEIIFSAPETDLDGLVKEPHESMLFAWKGNVLYWCEPGNVDAWPAFYSMNLPYNIKAAVPFAGMLAVLTEGGPMRVDGSHPERLSISKVLGVEPAVSASVAETQQGVVYVSDSGLVLFDSLNTSVFSDKIFGEAAFAGMDLSSSHVIENDNQLFLFHSTGTLVLDARDMADLIWTTLPMVAQASAKRKDTGEAFVLVGGDGVYQLGGDTDYKTWTWKSGKLLMKSEEDKHFDRVVVRGSGTVTLTLHLDGVQVATKALSFGGLLRNRSLGFPEDSCSGRHAEVELTGTGEVYEVVVYSEEDSE